MVSSGPVAVQLSIADPVTANGIAILVSNKLCGWRAAGPGARRATQHDTAVRRVCLPGRRLGPARCPLVTRGILPTFCLSLLLVSEADPARHGRAETECLACPCTVTARCSNPHYWQS